MGDDFAYFISAVREDSPDGIGYFLSMEYDLNVAEMYRAAIEAGQVTTTAGIVDAGNWGMLVSAYAPIFCRNGRVIGLVGADIAQYFILEDTWNFILAMSVFVLMASLIFGFVLRQRIVVAMDKRHTLEQELAVQKENQRLAVAEESNKAKSRFLARMSHEIRTPITAVLGISEIQLQNPTLHPGIEESFAKIHSSSNLLLSIVNDILDLSKIEAGKMNLTNEKYETATMISNCSHLPLAYLSNKDIKFHINVNEDFPAILIGDAIRIEQILTNILSNSFKYTERGLVELSFHCESYRNDHINMIISISDTGVGMTEEELSAIYDEYARFYEDKTSFVVGTGLGMPIVYNLIQLMDANISFESKPGKGTTVTISIPQETCSKETLGKETAAKLQKFETQKAKQFKIIAEPMPYGSVLVVDDVDTNLYVVKGLLAFYDLNVETCISGYEALDKVKQGKVYDIIFMDYMMPGLNGIEAMQGIRSMGYTNPIIVLTANAMIGKAEEFIEKGFDGFISKPIQTKHLNKILQKYIKSKHLPEVAESNYLPDIIEKLKSDFVRKQKNTIQELTQAIEKGDTNAAHIIAHTLKGLSKLIKEEPLAKLAEQAEHQFESGKIISNNELQILENELTRVLDTIPPPKSIAILDELEPLLKLRKAECINSIAPLREIPEAAILVKLIEKLDFATAVKALNALRDIKLL